MAGDVASGGLGGERSVFSPFSLVAQQATPVRLLIYIGLQNESLPLTERSYTGAPDACTVHTCQSVGMSSLHALNLATAQRNVA